ncbi:GMC family oxidoreductase [Haloferax larsenii]|uniref:GMC family oxidoreductase n=1 Tax=Haloferax larsenii TaxID=302484 RepID=A0ABY5RFK4_HALLR|nr:GMC family oxidoreductase [Haloferax larsenii]UVE50228.1 GMC family oxidoreductase [Haloferax larsenii]
MPIPNRTTDTTADRTPSPRADVCIVGAGVAGGLVAAQLATAGFDVVVLDAGPRFDRSDDLARMETGLRPVHSLGDVWEMGGPRDRYTTAGEVAYPLNDLRVKGVGGTTLAWGGYTPRLHEKDFEMQSRYGLASDWPISYDDLEPYYARAEAELGVAGDDDNPFVERSSPFQMPAFPPSYTDTLFRDACEELGIAFHSLPKAICSEPYDGRSPCVGYSTCTPVCPSGAKYTGFVHIRKAEKAGARVIDRATVRRLEHGADGKTLEAAVYATPDGSQYRQEARSFVLAAGGVETARLLLLSASDAHPDGLANSSGAVGRNFMDHLYVNSFATLTEPLQQEPIGYVTSQSQEFYDHDDPTPGSVMLTFGNIQSVKPIEVALRGGDAVLREDLDDTIMGNRWGDELLDSLQSRISSTPGELAIYGAVEMLPDPDNRITLDRSTTDAFGDPVPNVRLSPDAHARTTGEFATEKQREILRALPVPTADISSSNTFGLGAHHMGTARMGDDPETSVVDAELRTHDVDNLFVASSAAFTTGGAANPTLTIAALSLKAADALERELRQE